MDTFSIFKKKKWNFKSQQQGSGEMAQVVKSLLYKYEGLGSDPQDPRKETSMVTCGCNLGTSRTGQAASRAPREPARPSVSLGSLRDCVKKQGGET